MPHFSKLVLVMFGIGAAAGCNKEAERAPATANGQNGRAAESDDAMQPASRTRSAAEQIAEARCDREFTCGNIGRDQAYASTDECRSRVKDDWRADLGAVECPGGVNQGQLQECLTQIRAESCDNPFDTLSRIAACTQGQLCIDED